MNPDISILLLTAVSLGFIRTVLGFDHHVPFIVMSKAGKWSKLKTVGINILSGPNHVLSSVVIGTVGIAFGFALHEIFALESYGGEIIVDGEICKASEFRGCYPIRHA